MQKVIGSSPICSTSLQKIRSFDRIFFRLCNLGMQMGVAITFVVTGYEEGQFGVQPTIGSFKAVQDNFHWNINNL